MASSKTKAPEQTFEEPKYLRRLAESRARVGIKLTSNEQVNGQIEFYDECFIRLTREGQPNLFIYKHEIKYLWEINQPAFAS